ncbi:YncE family protein [Desulfuromonas sp.]|uniref:YncE family protein n=1 Tax=Desulfuromonas sp. TaxID=892 RepID=UPI0025BA0DF6|nr:YncE family protein [Desulfuromonas sp.]
MRGTTWRVLAALCACGLLLAQSALAAPFLYVGNEAGDSLSVVDLASNTVSETISVGDGPFNLMTSPNDRWVYTINAGDGTLSKVDTETNLVVDTIVLGVEFPKSAAMTPDGTHLYVTYGFNTPRGVAQVNLGDNSVTLIEIDGFPRDLKVTPDGKSVIVGNSPLVVIDRTNGNAVTTYDIGAPTSGVVVDAARNKVYLANDDGGPPWMGDGPDRQTVTVMDYDPLTQALNNARTIAVGALPRFMVLSSDGLKLYVVNEGDQTLAVIDTTTESVENTVAFGDLAMGAVISDDGATLYLPKANSNAAAVFDTATQTFLADISNIGSVPSCVTYVAQVGSLYDQEYAYVGNTQDDTVSVIDLGSQTVDTVIPVGDGPFWMVPGPDGLFVFSVNANDGTVSRIDTDSNAVVSTIDLGVTFPRAGAISIDGALLAVTCDIDQSTTGVALVDVLAETVELVPLPTVNFARGVTISPDSSAVIVGGMPLAVIDLMDNNAVTTYDIGKDGAGVALNPTTSQLFVANDEAPFDNTVTVMDFDPETRVLSNPQSITVGNQPRRMALSPDTAKLYVSNEGDATFSIIDTGTLAVDDTIAIGDISGSLAFSTDGARLYLTKLTNDSLAVFNVGTKNYIADLPVGDGPDAVCTINKNRPDEGFAIEGTDVTVNAEPTDPGSPQTELVFDEVTDPGIITVEPVAAPSAPDNFVLVGDKAFDITSTATFFGSVTVCLDYDEADLPQGTDEASLRLLHHDGLSWVNITTVGSVDNPNPDTVNNTICGETASLSPFGVGAPQTSDDTPVSSVGASSPARVPVLPGAWGLFAALLGCGLIARRRR